MTRRAAVALCALLLAVCCHQSLAQEESSAETAAAQEPSANSPSLPSQGSSGGSGESSETSAQVDAAREFIDLVYAAEYPRTTKDIESYVQQKFARHPYFSSFFLHSIDVSSAGTPVTTFLGNNIRAYKIAKPDMSVPIKPEDQDPAKAEPEAPKASELKVLPKKKRILFTSGIQGDQRTGIVQTLDLMGYVLRNPAVQKRLEDTGMELWFIPLVNPDGYDLGRRKNTHLAPCLGTCNDWKPGSNITAVSSTTVAPGSCRAEWVTEWNTVIDEFLKHNPNMKRDKLCRVGLVYKDGSFINGGTDIDSNFPSFQPDLLDGQTCRSADPLNERFTPTAVLIDEKTGQAKFKLDMSRDTALETETSAVMMFSESLQPWAAVSVHSGAETGSIVLPDREVTCQNEDFFMKHVCGGWDKHKKLNHVPAELQSLLSCGHSGDRQCGNLEDFLANNYGTIAVKLNLHSGKRESMEKPLNFGPVPKKAAELAGLPEPAYWKQLRLFSEYFIEFIAGLSDRIPGPKLAPTSAREIFKSELKSFKCREGKSVEKGVAAAAAVAEAQAPSEGASPQQAGSDDGPSEQAAEGAPSGGQEAPSAQEQAPSEAPAPGGDDAPKAGDDAPAPSAGGDGSAGGDAPNGQPDGQADGPTEARFGGRRLATPSAGEGEQDLQSNIRQSVTGIAEAINEIESIMKKESEQVPHWIGKPKARESNRKSGSVFVMEPANDLYEGWPW